MSDTLRQAVESLAPEIVAWRRDFHRHPELGFEEVRTSGIVAERLKALGLDAVRTGVGRTGVVGFHLRRGVHPFALSDKRPRKRFQKNVDTDKIFSGYALDSPTHNWEGLGRMFDSDYPETVLEFRDWFAAEQACRDLPGPAALAPGHLLSNLHQ